MKFMAMGRERPTRPTPVAYVVAAIALLLASVPWTGDWVPAIDRLSPAWPLAPVLALGSLVLANGRGIVLAGVLVALGLCVPVVLTQPVPAATPQPGLRLRVITHNVWTRNVDPAGTAAMLARSGADLLLLQETEGNFAPMLSILAGAFPYSSRCRHRCTMVILSRYPIERVWRGAPGRFWAQINPGMLTTVLIRLPGGGIVPVATVHLARGQRPRADLRQRAGLAQAMRRANGEALILAGDFNMVPWSVRMHALDKALAPLTRTTATFSWPARVGKYPALPLAPIDHLYAGPGWALADVHRLERTGSDHYPIAVDLIWQGRATMVTDPH